MPGLFDAFAGLRMELFVLPEADQAPVDVFEWLR